MSEVICIYYLTDEDDFFKQQGVEEARVRSPKDLIDLGLADKDYSINQFFSFKHQLLYDACRLFTANLNVFSFLDNELMKINDYKKNELVIYSRRGQIF